jgi:hypothetical protein
VHAENRHFALSFFGKTQRLACDLFSVSPHVCDCPQWILPRRFAVERSVPRNVIRAMSFAQFITPSFVACAQQYDVAQRHVDSRHRVCRNDCDSVSASIDSSNNLQNFLNIRGD